MLKTCSFSGCDGEYCAKGLCMAHYQQTRRGSGLHPVRRRRKVHRHNHCSFANCARPRYGRQKFCKAHYQQVHRGYSFGPVRQYHFRMEVQDASASS